MNSNKDTTTGPNEIDFASGLSGTITLTTGELLIANHDVSIVGPGQRSLTVSGDGKQPCIRGCIGYHGVALGADDHGRLGR